MSSSVKFIHLSTTEVSHLIKFVVMDLRIPATYISLNGFICFLLDKISPLNKINAISLVMAIGLLL